MHFSMVNVVQKRLQASGSGSGHHVACACAGLSIAIASRAAMAEHLISNDSSMQASLTPPPESSRRVSAVAAGPIQSSSDHAVTSSGAAHELVDIEGPERPIIKASKKQPSREWQRTQELRPASPSDQGSQAGFHTAACAVNAGSETSLSGQQQQHDSWAFMLEALAGGKSAAWLSVACLACSMELHVTCDQAPQWFCM